MASLGRDHPAARGRTGAEPTVRGVTAHHRLPSSQSRPEKDMSRRWRLKVSEPPPSLPWLNRASRRIGEADVKLSRAGSELALSDPLIDVTLHIPVPASHSDLVTLGVLDVERAASPHLFQVMPPGRLPRPDRQWIRRSWQSSSQRPRWSRRRSTSLVSRSLAGLALRWRVPHPRLQGAPRGRAYPP